METLLKYKQPETELEILIEEIHFESGIAFSCGKFDWFNRRLIIYQHFKSYTFFQMRKLKTTSEPCETTESALEMQPITTGNGTGDLTRGNTIILNPALHSAAANLTGSTVGEKITSRINRSRAAVATASKSSKNRPPAFVLTKDTAPLASGSGNGAITPQPPHSASSSSGFYHGGHRYFWFCSFQWKF